jgi:serine/threonine protein phosphatase PrpC
MEPLRLGNETFLGNDVVMAKLNLTSCAASDKGLKRESNEDSWFNDDDLGLYVVCDGMGGHQAGEIASSLAVDAVVEVVREKGALAVMDEDGEWDTSQLVLAVEEAVSYACRVVHETAIADPDKAGMGCTLTMLLVSESKAVMGHVGDTRLYLLRNNKSHQLSQDHTMAAQLAQMGMIEAEEVRGHQFAHVLTRSIGSQLAVQIDVLEMDLLPKDRFVLCSDGLSDYLASSERLLSATTESEPERRAESLVDIANDAGGHDNVTAIVVDVLGLPNVTSPSVDPGRQLRTLAGVPLFDEEFISTLMRIASAGETHDYADGERVISYNEPIDGVYIPVTGILRVTSPDGKVREIGRGDVLGERVLFHPRRALGTVTAHQGCRAIVLNTEAFKLLAQKDPWFGISVLERLGARLSRQLDERDGILESR